MRRIVGLISVVLLVSPHAPLSASSGSNMLDNPTLLEGRETNVGEEPIDWTRRGSLEFSSAGMIPKDEAYKFKLTADGSVDFPNCSDNQPLHPGGSEAGYFQVHRSVSGGQTWRTKIGSKLMTGGRARLLLYAKDASGGNLEWKADLSGKGLKKWRPLRVTMQLPTGTNSVLVALRGRVCQPGTETFRFRRAVLRQLSD